VPDPDVSNYDAYLNPNSLVVLSGCKLEKSLAEAKPGDGFQFMRQGYFCADSKDSTPDHLVFNRSVSLKDSFKA
ncbi:MAG: glutamine--tRNA ligase, partial [Clostridia bacterium]|nr:glutamine--tRNA ligase [Clostridia bacterium]